MTQEDKELLLRDLSARLPYGVIVQCFSNNKEVVGAYAPAVLKKIDAAKQCGVFGFEVPIEDIKPYLRPMSSMTEEEEKEFLCISNQSPGYLEMIIQVNSRYNIILPIESFDWLNAHHFDYRGLIEKGLALEAPEGMYNIKEK